MKTGGISLLPTHEFLLFIFLSKNRENHLNDKEKSRQRKIHVFFRQFMPKNPPNRRQQWLAIFEFLLFSFLSKKREENLNDKEKNVVACKKVDKEIPNSCPKKPLIDVNNDLQFFPALKRFFFFCLSYLQQSCKKLLDTL